MAPPSTSEATSVGVDARSSRGAQIGDRNTQFNYFFPPNRVVVGIGALAGLGPPLVVLLASNGWVGRNPAFALFALFLYESLVLLWIFGLKVAMVVSGRWVARLSDSIDSAMQRFFSRYSRRYRRYVAQILHDVDVKGLTIRGSHSLSMDDVFVDLGLTLIPLGSVNGRLLRHTLPEGKKPKPRVPVWALINDSLGRPMPLAVLGPPGCGKTTLLKYVALSLVKRRADVGRSSVAGLTPILLYLREHADAIVADPAVTIGALARSALGTLGRDEPPGWLDARIRRGKCFILLDGLDEVAKPEDRRLVVEWADKQIAAFPHNHFMITARPYGYKSNPLSRAAIAEVSPFSSNQIVRFVHGWYRATNGQHHDDGKGSEGYENLAREGADDLLRRLRENVQLYALAGNPLLLTMLCHVHHYCGALPGTRAELYREICQVFIGKRQAAKGIISKLKFDQKEFVLRDLAFKMMQNNKRDVTLDQAAAFVRDSLRRVDPNIDPADFVVEIEQTCGLITERENGEYCFAHMTFQEYLAAAHIAERNLVEVLARNVTDSWWHETALLYVAQHGGDAVVDACLRQHVSSFDAFALAAECAEEARELDPILRLRVEELLSVTSARDDIARLNLAAGVALLRRLRRVTWVNGDSFVCVSPVGRKEYNLFLASNGDTQRSTPRGVDVPILGIRHGEVDAFVSWAGDLVGNVRIPTATEVGDVLRQVAHLRQYSIWANDDGKYRLIASHLPRIDDVLSLFGSQLRRDACFMAGLISDSEEDHHPMLSQLWRGCSMDMISLGSLAIGTDCRNWSRLKVAMAVNLTPRSVVWGGADEADRPLFLRHQAAEPPSPPTDDSVQTNIADHNPLATLAVESLDESVMTNSLDDALLLATIDRAEQIAYRARLSSSVAAITRSIVHSHLGIPGASPVFGDDLDIAQMLTLARAAIGICAVRANRMQHEPDHIGRGVAEFSATYASLAIQLCKLEWRRAGLFDDTEVVLVARD